MSKRLKDYVSDRNQVELNKNLDKIIKKSKLISSWLEENTSRSDKRVILSNLLTSTSDYLELLKSSLGSHVSVLALCTRNIYEINIRVRSLVEHQEELAKWQSEAVTDKVQTLEGILSLTNASENIDEQRILSEEIDRLKGLLIKYGIPVVRQPDTAGSIACRVGQEGEHKAFFKLYSKLVHPSSYLVNDYAGASCTENKKILQIHAQLYSYDTIIRVCKELEVPYELSKPYGQA